MNYLERILRNLAVWVFSLVFWTLFAVGYLFTLKLAPPTLLAKVIQVWGHSALWLLGIRLEILNENTFKTQGARVVIVNHQSGLDLTWGAVICPPAPLAIGKKEILYVPVFNLVWWLMDFIRIDRSNHVRAVASLRGVAELIVRGQRTLIVAPEGTRTPDGSILPFKKGAFIIARQAGVPIHPVVISGAFELLPKKSLLPRKGTIRLRFLPPVSIEGVAQENENEFIQKIRQDMIRALQEIRQLETRV